MHNSQGIGDENSTSFSTPDSMPESDTRKRPASKATQKVAKKAGKKADSNPNFLSRWPKGPELAERIACATRAKRLSPEQLYQLLAWQFVKQPKAVVVQLAILAREGIDLRDNQFTFDAEAAPRSARN